MPSLSSNDVLVIESGAPFRTGPVARTYWPTSSAYAGILGNESAIAAACGDRTFLTATDADFHAIRGDSGNYDAFSGCAVWDGARGHLINAIDWAGSGTGLGIVGLFNINEFAQNPNPSSGERYWWDDTDSFLHDERHGYFQSISSSNKASITTAAAKLALNEGLTAIAGTPGTSPSQGGPILHLLSLLDKYALQQANNPVRIAPSTQLPRWRNW